MEFSSSSFSSLFPTVEREGRRKDAVLTLEEQRMEQSSDSKNYRIEECEGIELESGNSKHCARGHWRPAEDARLKDLVAQYGPQNWNLIAEKLEGRSGKSCRLRWFNQLDPRINKKAFTEEEEEKLLSAHRLYGNKWALISRLFPGRTDNAVKNHWHVIMARRQREQSKAYRRRKPCTSSKMFDNRMEVKYSNNACSPESISGNGFENLCISRGFPPHGFLTRCSLPQPTSRFEYLIDGKLVGGRNGCYERTFDAAIELHHAPPLIAVPGIHHSHHSGLSDSYSDASATDSVIKNGFMSEEAEELEKEKISLPFFDFLGVGAT